MIRYFELTTEQLEEEQAKQAEVVRTASQEEFMDEWHKLGVIQNMLDWRAVEAARFGGGKRSARKPKVSARQQAGPFEFGSKSKVSRGQSEDPLSGLTTKEKGEN
ncbi:MAG: hypothetical protein ACJ73N_00590 [Bryobacteraceae bacterium]